MGAVPLTHQLRKERQIAVALDKCWAGSNPFDELPVEVPDLLADRLAALGLDAQTYLTKVLFVDDTRDPSCVTGVMARTAPGSRVVRLCSEELKRTWQGDPAHVVAALIHEMLHTLGLGENPPTSKAITARVLARCR